MVYLDYNASAPLLEVARHAMIKVLGLQGNPSAVHAYGRNVRKMMEEARHSLAGLMGVQEREVIFTSSATEANNQVLASMNTLGMPVVVSALEHDSVYKIAPDAFVIKAEKTGIIDLNHLEDLLKSVQPSMNRLISVMAANNETGVVQPILEVSKLVRHYGGYLHVDASQAVGRIQVNLQVWDVDYLTFSSHKLGGPMGAGALIARERRPLEALVQGGGQEQNRRAGTQNAAAIVGFAAAAQAMAAFDWGPIQMLREKMEKEIQTLEPNVTVYGKEMERLPNTSCLSMPGVSNEVQVMAFDLEGFAVSAGSACSSGKVKASRVLQAMGFGEEESKEAIRVSLCPETSRPDMEKFVQCWRSIYEHAYKRTNNSRREEL